MPLNAATRFQAELSSLEHVEVEEVVVSWWLVPGVVAYARPGREASEPWSEKVH